MPTRMTVSPMASGGKTFSETVLHSFNPLLTWMRLIGITNVKSKCLSLEHVYGLLCLLFDVVGELDVLYYLKSPELYISAFGDCFNSFTFSWNITVDFINFAIQGVGAHLILFVVVRHRLFHLLNALRHCEFILDSAFYTRLRHLCIAGVIFIVGMVT